ncbi:TonB-dependent siderophore receptor [Derxia lacustris]|uniref:TonB-dependent siderophore receptor n=1 Tax=Derxia lacustris TaxID=764842 RepID=UPI001F363662|nr:TonB-dependent siderophore receptor [Derxia lacustris]
MRIGLLGLACAGAAQAQQAPEPVGEAVLPIVNVSAGGVPETATGRVQGYVAKRSATATRTDTPLNEVAQSVSVITADQIADQASQSLQDALRYTAGVRAETYGLDNRGDWFKVRGADAATLLDGLRLPLSGWYGVMRNEPYAFERIEVLRGPSSVMAGQNAPGGLVNLVSKRPLDEAAREIAVQVGNRDHKQLMLDMTGPLDDEGRLLYRLVALGKDSGTQVDHADDKRLYFAPSLTWKIDADTRLTTYAEYQYDRSGTTNAFYTANGTLNEAPHGRIPDSTFISEPGWDRYGGRRQRIGYEFSTRLDEHWTLRQNSRLDHVKGGLRSMYAAFWDGFVDATGASDPNGTYMNRVAYATDDMDRIASANLLLEGRFETGSIGHRLLFGADVIRQRSDQTAYAEQAATPLDVYNPVYGAAVPAFDYQPATVSYNRSFGLLAQDQIRLDPAWLLTLGVRRDRARSDIKDGTGQTNSATSKNVGLVHRAADWSPYLSYSESFEPVSGTDAGGALFKPKRGRQVEAGLKWQPASGRMRASAAVFRLVEKNRLATDPTDVSFQVQRGEATTKGLELEGGAELSAWSLLAQYTYTDAEVTSTTPDDARYLGKQIESIPKHSAAAWAMHKLGVWGLAGARAGLGVRYAGRSWDGIGVQSVPSVTLVDAAASYDLRDWRFALNINNLADRDYVATCLERSDCWRGTRRRIVLSAAYRF